MRRITQALLPAVVFSLTLFSENVRPDDKKLQPESVTFKSADGILIHGDLHSVEAGKSAPLILLFHQAGGNARAEYGPLIPRLLDDGFNVLAVDQRVGGDRLGGTNRTVDGLPEGAEYSYCDVYPDLVASLRFVVDRGFTGKRFAWGSSYSAALVLRLGAEHSKEIDGVLAFSPASGGPMAACKADPFLPNLTIPALALRPGREMEIESVREQLEMLKTHHLKTYVAANGVHGSSMLNPARVKADVAPQWNAVLAFLHEVLAQTAASDGEGS